MRLLAIEANATSVVYYRSAGADAAGAPADVPGTAAFGCAAVISMILMMRS